MMGLPRSMNQEQIQNLPSEEKNALHQYIDLCVTV